MPRGYTKNRSVLVPAPYVSGRLMPCVKTRPAFGLAGKITGQHFSSRTAPEKYRLILIIIDEWRNSFYTFLVKN